MSNTASNRCIEGGVSVADVATAHQADLAAQGEHSVNYLRYVANYWLTAIRLLQQSRAGRKKAIGSQTLRGRSLFACIVILLAVGSSHER